MFILGLIATVIGIGVIINFKRFLESADIPNSDSCSIGVGLYLLIISGLAVCISSFAISDK